MGHLNLCPVFTIQIIFESIPAWGEGSYFRRTLGFQNTSAEFPSGKPAVVCVMHPGTWSILPASQLDGKSAVSLSTVSLTAQWQPSSLVLWCLQVDNRVPFWYFWNSSSDCAVSSGFQNKSPWSINSLSMSSTPALVQSFPAGEKENFEPSVI